MTNRSININREQLFSRGERVQVNIYSESMPEPLSYQGIIVCTHDEEFKSKDIHSYKIIVINDKEEPEKEIKWIHENKIVSIYSDLAFGEGIISQFYKKSSNCN